MKKNLSRKEYVKKKNIYIITIMMLDPILNLSVFFQNTDINEVIFGLSQLKGFKIENPNLFVSTVKIPTCFDFKHMILATPQNIDNFHAQLHLYNSYLLRIFYFGITNKLYYDRYIQYQNLLFTKYMNPVLGFQSDISESAISFGKVDWFKDKPERLFINNELKVLQSNAVFLQDVIFHNDLTVANFATAASNDVHFNTVPFSLNFHIPTEIVTNFL